MIDDDEHDHLHQSRLPLRAYACMYRMYMLLSHLCRLQHVYIGVFSLEAMIRSCTDARAQPCGAYRTHENIRCKQGLANSSDRG